MMKNRKDMEAEAVQRQFSDIAQRKIAFQEENRRQMREGLVHANEISFIPREVAKSAKFRFKV